MNALIANYVIIVPEGCVIIAMNFTSLINRLCSVLELVTILLKLLITIFSPYINMQGVFILSNQKVNVKILYDLHGLHKCLCSNCSIYQFIACFKPIVRSKFGSYFSKACALLILARE